MKNGIYLFLFSICFFGGLTANATPYLDVRGPVKTRSEFRNVGSVSETEITSFVGERLPDYYYEYDRKGHRVLSRSLSYTLSDLLTMVSLEFTSYDDKGHDYLYQQYLTKVPLSMTSHCLTKDGFKNFPHGYTKCERTFQGDNEIKYVERVKRFVDGKTCDMDMVRSFRESFYEDGRLKKEISHNMDNDKKVTNYEYEFNNGVLNRALAYENGMLISIEEYIDGKKRKVYYCPYSLRSSFLDVSEREKLFDTMIYDESGRVISHDYPSQGSRSFTFYVDSTSIEVSTYNYRDQIKRRYVIEMRVPDRYADSDKYQLRAHVGNNEEYRDMVILLFEKFAKHKISFDELASKMEFIVMYNSFAHFDKIVKDFKYDRYHNVVREQTKMEIIANNLCKGLYGEYEKKGDLKVQTSDSVVETVYTYYE